MQNSNSMEPNYVVDTSDMKTDTAPQTRSIAATSDKFSVEISDVEASIGVRMLLDSSRNSARFHEQGPSAVSSTLSSAASLCSKTRSESESTSKSDATGMKDWGWFDDMHDDHDGSTQMFDINDKEDSSKSRIKDCYTDDGKGSSSLCGIGSDVIVNSCTDEDAKMHDVEDNSIASGKRPEKKKKKKKRMLELEFDLLNGPLDGIVNSAKKDEGTSMAVTAPMYVLEESPSCQTLWRDTAGTRPPQPIEERLFYESMWVKNFERSNVKYHMPVDVLTATTPISLSPFADGNFANEGNESKEERDANHNVQDGGTLSGGIGGARTNNGRVLGPYVHHHTVVNKTVKDHNTGDELTVLVKGDNVFGTTVSKSFLSNGSIPGPVESVSVSVGSYRVVESKKHGKYAQFLVIFCAGTFRETFGVWKRYSDFKTLSHQVSHGTENCTSVLVGMGPLSVTEDHAEIMPNAMMSWSLVKKRKRWYRCLDAGYLSIKVFLLERFLHDILYESTSPKILRDFVGVSQ